MATTLEPSNTMQVFITNVKARMEAAGVSVSELSRRTGMDRTSLSAILNGRGGSCTLATCDRIAKSLGVSTISLLS